MLDILAEAMVQSKYAGNEKGFLLDAYPMNLEQVHRKPKTFSITPFSKTKMTSGTSNAL